MTVIKQASVAPGVVGIFVAVAVGLSSCAKRARDIEAAEIDPAIYAGESCERLVKRRARVAEKLIFAGSAQDQVAEDDRIRTMGAPTFMGTVFEGGHEDEVARLKGELHALNRQLEALRCE